MKPFGNNVLVEITIAQNEKLKEYPTATVVGISDYITNLDIRHGTKVIFYRHSGHPIGWTGETGNVRLQYIVDISKILALV